MEFNVFEMEMIVKEKREEWLRANSNYLLLCSMPIVKNSARCGCK
ncbi:hypothetical protein ACFQPF_05170 [Fictibacillus iocasae]|uniref:Uncharacterized protein n=1 Tax=Fictibacillus iocasae TaxID=2715437 RepID=A0ABW2NN59_9BACL